MAWNDLTFVECSLLTAAKMTALQGNFAALAAQESGAPPLRFPNSGPYGDVPASFGTVHAASGFLGPQVSSLGTLHVAGGVVAPGVSSFGQVQVASGFARVDAASGFGTAAPASLGTVEVASNASFFGGLRFPHFALRFDPGNPPTVHRATNVSCLQRAGAGKYLAHISPAFTNSDYFLLKSDASLGGANIGVIGFLQDSSTLSRVGFEIRRMGDNALTDGGNGYALVGFGD